MCVCVEPSNIQDVYFIQGEQRSYNYKANNWDGEKFLRLPSTPNILETFLEKDIM